MKPLQMRLSPSLRGPAKQYAQNIQWRSHIQRRANRVLNVSVCSIENMIFDCSHVFRSFVRSLSWMCVNLSLGYVAISATRWKARGQAIVVVIQRAARLNEGEYSDDRGRHPFS